MLSSTECSSHPNDNHDREDVKRVKCISQALVIGRGYSCNTHIISYLVSSIPCQRSVQRNIFWQRDDNARLLRPLFLSRPLKMTSHHPVAEITNLFTTAHICSLFGTTPRNQWTEVMLVFRLHDNKWRSHQWQNALMGVLFRWPCHSATRPALWMLKKHQKSPEPKTPGCLEHEVPPKVSWGLVSTLSSAWWKGRGSLTQINRWYNGVVYVWILRYN